MATKKSFLNFILDQLSDLEGITYRQMMGEYIIYHKGKITAYLCDDKMFIKPVPKVVDIMNDAKYEVPYEGSKEMLLVENIDDRVFLQELFLVSYDELQFPKMNKKGKTDGKMD